VKVEIFRVTGNPVFVEVQENGTIRDAFSQPESGQAMGHDGTLLDVAERLGGMEKLGTLRLNGQSATLDTPVTAGATILLIPKVEGGAL